MSGPCLSACVAGRALTPATRHRLGKPLPYQQADRAQAPPKAGSYALYLVQSTRTMGNYPPFQMAMPLFRVDSYVLLTRPPLTSRPARGNPKSEIRNPKQYLMFKILNPKRRSFGTFEFSP